MSRTRELAAGGRAVEVEPERLAGFLDRFAAGHSGAVVTTVTPQRVDVTAVDSWTASVPVLFGSLSAQSCQQAGLAADDLLEHLVAPRTSGCCWYAWAGTAALDGSSALTRPGYTR